MTHRRRRSARGLGALLGLITVSCSPDPVAVVTGLEILVAEGDGQFGTVGQTLGTPLRAVVRAEATQEPQEGVTVRWDVEAGGATLLSGPTGVTDETGSVEALVRLGPVPAEVTIRAALIEQPGASAVFAAYTVDPPVLAEVRPGSAAVGDTVMVTGSNFSPIPDQNVVLFSGIRGRVVDASQAQLLVEVPACLPARPVEVTVQLGVIASDAKPFTVTEGGELARLAVGHVIDVSDASGLACHALEGGPGIEYLAIVYSSSTVGAARYPFELRGLSSVTAPTAQTAVLRAPDSPAVSGVLGGAQALWDRRLRWEEEQLVARERDRVRESPPPRSPMASPAPVPTTGERRTFSVWTGTNEFEQVSAVAQYVGSEVAIFVDEEAPTGGFTPVDLQLFAGRFDEVIQPEVTSHFGSASDLDQNERVIVLFTPVVNGLTERGASGFIGGFFFGNDLLPENTGSNGGEVFYALVPDPAGIHSDPRTKEAVLDVVPAVLAHEFQHMVQFNERFLLLDAGQEALWLGEALAQMAEEVVARRYDALGNSQSEELFRSGVRARATRYLVDTGAVSLIVSTGHGSLAERGAGFLFLLYLTDREGIDLLGRLSTTTRTGVANVEAEVGPWSDLLRDWWSATYLDPRDPSQYPGIDLEQYLGGELPLLPEPLGPGSETRSGELWSSSASYYVLSPDESGSMSVRLGGEAGGQSSSQADLRLRVVRIS